MRRVMDNDDFYSDYVDYVDYIDYHIFFSKRRVDYIDYPYPYPYLYTYPYLLFEKKIR